MSEPPNDDSMPHLPEPLPERHDPPRLQAGAMETSFADDAPFAEVEEQPIFSHLEPVLPSSEPIALGRRDTGAEVRRRLTEVLAAYGNHPLVDEIAWLSGHYMRLANRLNKIARISDRLQAQVIDNNKALFERAASDPLTGLLNRAGVLQQIGMARERVAREGTSFGLLLIDLDHFKVINDRFGHAAGDRVLVDVAQTLRTHTRTSDACARWGGEEFLVLLPSCDLAGLEAVANKLLTAVSQVALDVPPAPLYIGCSIGTYLGERYESPEESIRRADTALYRAKRTGRARVTHFDPTLDSDFVLPEDPVADTDSKPRPTRSRKR